MQQQPLSTPELIYKAITRKTYSLADFSPQAIEFKNISCSFGLLTRFEKAFAHPNKMPSFMLVACYKLLIQLLTQCKIPSKLGGLIHISTKFTLNSEHDWQQPYDVKVELESFEEVDAGIVYSVETSLFQQGELTWKNVNKVLAKNKSYHGKKAAVKSTKLTSEPIAIHTITQKTALEYARLSNDYNPIHLSTPTAKLFGLKKAVIHGMYNAHFVLYQLLKQDKLTGKNITIAFNKPCYLPNKVCLHQTSKTMYGLFSEDGAERYLKLVIR